MPSPTPSADRCPSCGAPLSADAVICVQCGLDQQTGVHIATAFADEARVPPEASAAKRYPIGSVDPFADDEDTALAGRIVRDAGAMLALCAFAVCVLQILTPFFAIWSLVRLAQWYRLRDRCQILRDPNSLSPHYDVAMKFNACRIRLWISFAIFTSIAVVVTLGFINKFTG